MGTDTTTLSDPGAGTLRDAMVDRLRERGVLADARVISAMRAVPRHLFVPDAPLVRAYSGESVVTHRDAQGVATSSVSEAGIVAVMLQQLDLQPGDRVLEIGAGTAYNAALLAELAGPSGAVTSIDIDAVVVQEAGQRLRSTGYGSVGVVCADGDAGDGRELVTLAGKRGASPPRSAPKARCLGELVDAFQVQPAQEGVDTARPRH